MKPEIYKDEGYKLMGAAFEMGGTGDSPVPVGDPPTGRAGRTIK